MPFVPTCHHRSTLALALAASLAIGGAANGQEAQGVDIAAASLPDYFANLPDLPPIVGEAIAWDGDTLHFPDLDIRVRLHAVAAPEMGEWPWGPWARAVVDDMIDDHAVTCRPNGDETHGRPVAICGTDRIPDIGLALIATGLATEHRAYSREGIVGDAYSAAEAIGRESRRGIWRDFPPMAPPNGE